MILDSSHRNLHGIEERKKRGGGWDGVGREWEGAGRGIQTGEGWRLQKEDGKETGGSEYGFSIPAASLFFFSRAMEQLKPV